MLISVSFYCYGDPRDLHSFPTRRSSDLEEPGRQRLPTDRASRMALRVSLELADGPSSYQIRIERVPQRDRKSTRLNSSHGYISYAVFCLKKKKLPTPGIRRQEQEDCAGC